MRVLITGGAGFIGSHLADRLLKDGFQVRILDSLDSRVHPGGAPAYLNSAAEFIHGDVTDRYTLLAALQNVDIVFHEAAYQDYMPDYSRFLYVNAFSTALLYELIVEHRLPIKKIVVASSQSVYGEGQYLCADHGRFLPMPRSREQLARGQWDVQCPECDRLGEPLFLKEEHNNPFNQYAVSKLAEEKIALGMGWLKGLPTVALRYSITQGPRQSLFNQYSGICRIFVGRAIKKQPLIIYEDGLQTRDYVHIADVIDANMCVLEKDAANFHAFNVGGGTAVSVLEYANLVRQSLSSRAEVIVSGEYRLGDNRHSVSSIEKLKTLGWRPKRDLQTILNDFLAWVDSIGGMPEVTNAYDHMKTAGVVLKSSMTPV